MTEAVRDAKGLVVYVEVSGVKSKKPTDYEEIILKEIEEEKRKGVR